ncbi:hypothetical protein PS619_00214 [Pseudomonas fluorescens]|nr:hypothetical protein PS619_00214 [Pseudomonas fluorescens]
MSTNAKNRKRLAIGAGVGFAIALGLALLLLYIKKFTGAEFTVFVLAFAVLGVAIGFAPEVQEISIVGNIVKLKEVRSQAIERLNSLQRTQVELWRFILRTRDFFVATHPSRPNESVLSKEFWVIYREAEALEAVGLLKDELSMHVSQAIACVYGSLHNLKPDISIKSIESTTYLDLAAELLSAEGLTKIYERWDFNYGNSFPVPEPEVPPTPASDLVGKENFVIYIKKRLDEYVALERLKDEIESAPFKSIS